MPRVPVDQQPPAAPMYPNQEHWSSKEKLNAETAVANNPGTLPGPTSNPARDASGSSPATMGGDPVPPPTPPDQSYVRSVGHGAPTGPGAMAGNGRYGGK